LAFFSLKGLVVRASIIDILEIFVFCGPNE